MRVFTEAILTKLRTVTGVAYAAVWNDQLTLDEGQDSYSFGMPAIFLEVVNSQEIKQLGDGVQLYDPLVIRLHLCHWQLDTGDGTMEQNLDVIDLLGTVYTFIDGFEPDGATAFVRGAEEKDYAHKGVYHALQDYKTTLIDLSQQRSTDGVTINAGTITPVINASYNPDPYLKGQ